jgi:hypothetical protein
MFSMKREVEMALKKLPVGIENFEKIRTQGFYYVDKTGMISDLLHNWGAVNLFTRPRQFGKSLNMNMLKSFFEVGCKKELFDGLKIAQEKELCEEYMGQYPVISIDLKDVRGSSFEAARNSLTSVIGTEARRFSFLAKSEKLSNEEKMLYSALTSATDDGIFPMGDTALINSLLDLSILLDKHYRRKVIVLIDAYDTPLDQASRMGYYEQMKYLIDRLLTCGLKTNSHIQFSVIAGILTDFQGSLLNINEHSITDRRFSEYFGFSEEEVTELLTYYGLSEKCDAVKEWCGGYHFGNADVYCPEAVIRFCEKPVANWNELFASSSSYGQNREIVRHFLQMTSKQTKSELEWLIAGKTIVKEIQLALAYNEHDRYMENRWGVLVATGSLTQIKCVDRKQYELKIPNRGIWQLIVEQNDWWFHETIQKDLAKLDAFCNALISGDIAVVDHLLNDYLWNTINVRDIALQEDCAVKFCYEVLLGLLHHKENWMVLSNTESEEGYSDILIEVPENKIGVVIELKYAEADKLEDGCAEALDQIDEKRYNTHLLADGMQSIVKYGIACFRKHCKVVKG